MKRHIFRVVVSVFAFVLGIGFVALFNFVTDYFENDREIQNTNPIVIKENIGIQKKQFGIEVKFKEFVKTENGLAVDFVVINTGTESVYYSVIRGDEKKEPVSTHHEVKVNGKKIEQWRCGMGWVNEEFKPGESKIFRLNGGVLRYFWQSGKSVQIGFFFGKKETQEFETYWGEILPINPSIEKQLLNEKNMWERKRI